MLKIDVHTKGVFLAGFLTWVITFSGAWITYTNAITRLETNQQILIQEKHDAKQELKMLADKVSENTRNGAVTNSVLMRLNDTLTKIDGSLDTIVNDTAKHSVRIKALEAQVNGEG